MWVGLGQQGRVKQCPGQVQLVLRFCPIFYGFCGFCCLCCFSIVHFTVGNVLFVVAIVILCVVSVSVSFHLVKVSVVILVIKIFVIVFLVLLLHLLPSHVEGVLLGLLHVHLAGRVEEHVNSRKWRSGSVVGCVDLPISSLSLLLHCCHFQFVLTLAVPPLAVPPTPGRTLSLRTSSTRPGLVEETVLVGAAGDNSWNREGQRKD